MRIIKIGSILLLSLSITLFCGKSGDDPMLLLPLANGLTDGGPGTSPDDSGDSDQPASDEQNPVDTVDEDTSGTGDDTTGGTTSGDDTTGGTTSGDDTTGGTDDSDGDDADDGDDIADGDNDDTGTGDDDGTGDDSGDTGSDDVSDGGENKKCPNRTITLDSSKGKWYTTPEGTLSGKVLSKADKKRIRVAIKIARKAMKAIRKGNKKAGIAQLKLKIKEFRAQIGHGKKVKGIHTYWANQKLYLRVRNNCKAGWYKLKVVAKNYPGKKGENLPDFYTHYNITVKNETTDRIAGGMFIKASDKSYHRARMLVYLDEGDTDLNLLWTNDAWKKGVYDANIQIKKVRLKYKRYIRKRKNLVRRAHQYCFTKGRWFWDRKTARTNWANQHIGFCFKNLKAGKYKVIVKAKNYGKVPEGYKNFKVMVAGDGVTGNLEIQAKENGYKKGSTVLDLTGGDTMVMMTWTNDKWVPSKGEDANIQIRKIRLKRVGDSDRSALAAYIMNASRGNRMVLIITMLLAVLGLGGIFFWNKMRHGAETR